MAVDRHTGDIAGHGLAQSFDNPVAGTTPRRAPTASAAFSAAVTAGSALRRTAAAHAGRRR
jgi:hypothetical protein